VGKFEQNMTDIFSLPEKTVEGEVVEVETKTISSSKDDIQNDYEYARENLRDTINHAKLALDELSNIASVTESPRAFEVYAQLTKTIVDANKDLLELQAKLKRVRENQPKQQVTNNSLFVGSTQDLFKIIKDNE
jgi:phage terminase small subunit